MTSRLAALVQQPFRGLHLAWVILILAGCVALVAMGGGHPPPMVFIPFVLVGGFVGHLLLLLSEWLLRKGRARLAVAHAEPAKWPPELVVITVAMGGIAIASIVITFGEYARLWSEPLVWLLLAAIAAAHAVTFVLLLLRFAAARYSSAVVCLGWALAFVLQIGEARPDELPIAIALIAGLVALAVYLLRARRIRSVLK